ncbi:MAG: hypothetical protein EBS18_02710 [Actinobacteria bacterium]|nr:hypothetical protein [Actinomycetota bacterium]
MANAITNITSQFSTPYLTIAEYKNAPTAIDYDNLVVGGNANAQDAELTNAITRASSWVDQYCNQVIGATIDTEQQRKRISSDGTIRFNPKYAPIVGLTSFSYGSDPTTLITAADCSIAWLEENTIIFPYANLATSYSSQGPLQFGFPGTAGTEVFIRYTYVSGYFNSTIVTATSSATSITVVDGTGITTGDMLKIYDGYNSENVTVASTYTFGSNTIPITSPLLYSHASGTAISDMPAAIKEATILATTAFLKIRGDNSLTLAVTTRGSEAVQGGQKIGTDLALAEQLLKPFRRIR